MQAYLVVNISRRNSQDYSLYPGRQPRVIANQPYSILDACLCGSADQ